MTKFEQLKAMSIAEMARFFSKCGICRYLQDDEKHCFKRTSYNGCVEEWLMAEVSENDEF